MSVYIEYAVRDCEGYTILVIFKFKHSDKFSGIGYKTYKDELLHGPDLISLYRIVDRNMDNNINRLFDRPQCKLVPEVTANGYDYTNRKHVAEHVDNLLGPDPPLLTHLEITSVKPFFDDSILDKPMRMSLVLKSDNVAETLKSWAVDRVIGPDSALLDVFHSTRSNNVLYDCDDSDLEEE